jgi:hypothetical protein
MRCVIQNALPIRPMTWLPAFIAILSSIPGVTAASPPGFAGQVSFRGFGSSSLTQLVNGITVQYDGIAARPVDGWIYDRVEAIGGPSTFLVGGGAVGGSINYITRTATRDPNQVRARASYGSYDTSELAAGVNHALGGTRVRHVVQADASRTHAKGYVDSEREAFTGTVSRLSDVRPMPPTMTSSRRWPAWRSRARATIRATRRPMWEAGFVCSPSRSPSSSVLGERAFVTLRPGCPGSSAERLSKPLSRSRTPRERGEWI